MWLHGQIGLYNKGINYSTSRGRSKGRPLTLSNNERATVTFTAHNKPLCQWELSTHSVLIMRSSKPSPIEMISNSNMEIGTTADLNRQVHYPTIFPYLISFPGAVIYPGQSGDAFRPRVCEPPPIGESPPTDIVARCPIFGWVRGSGCPRGTYPWGANLTSSPRVMWDRWVATLHAHSSHVSHLSSQNRPR